MVTVGIDLAAKPINPTGFAIWSDGFVKVFTVYTDLEIISLCLRVYPHLIAMDAPLTFSQGYREADKALMQMGIRVFPPNFISELVFRAMRLKARLGNVIEVFPGAFYKILKIKEEDLEKFVIFLNKPQSKHEVDAVACALTAAMTLEGKTEAVGKKGEKIIIPRKDAMPPLPKMKRDELLLL
ncbi:MAG: DUF429 domain-containing protein [Candidatus Jordarchaeales archaeon]